MLRVLAAALCIGALTVHAAAAQVDCDATYCFSAEEFSDGEELAGICITGLPDASTGTVMLGQRVLQPGDILTAEQVSRMTFHPLRTETDPQAMMTYLPIGVVACFKKVGWKPIVHDRVMSLKEIKSESGAMQNK